VEPGHCGLKLYQLAQAVLLFDIVTPPLPPQAETGTNED
jgi:hypothetical protein